MIVSFGIATVSHFYECDFLCNIMLGIFGSSFLTWLSVFIAYKISRREAIMDYLRALRIYRRKFKRMTLFNDGSENDWWQQKENLKDCFDEWYAAYSRIQHICKPLCKYRKLPKVLNESFQLVVDVQGHLNYDHNNYKAYFEDIDKAVNIVETLAREKKYLHTIKKKEQINNGQTENGNP